MKSFEKKLCLLAITWLLGLQVSRAEVQTSEVSFDLLSKASQFHPRDLVSNIARVMTPETIRAEGFDRIQLTITRNGTEVSVQGQGLVFDAKTNALFALSSALVSERGSDDFEV